MSGENPNVMCVGYLNADEVIHIDGELSEEKSARSNSYNTAGGGATNTALVLSGSDMVGDVWIAGAIGDDERGRLVLDALEENGVNLALPTYDDISTTKIRAVITESKKPMYTHENTELPDFSPSDVPEDVWEQLDHVHMTTFHKDMALEFAEEAKERGLSVSLNPTQGYFSTSFEDVVEIADLVQMNRQESEKFRERNGPLGTVVDDLDTDVVITHGPAGCTMHSQDGVVSHPGFPDYVDEVVDTIGAGDSFMAGLLASWLSGKELDICLEIANAHGAVSVTNIGAPNYIDPDDVRNVIGD